MANIVGSLLVKLSAMTAEFDTGLKKSASLLDGFGLSFRSITSGLSVGGFVALAAKMDDMSDAAEKLGISLHSYMVFDNVATRSATSIDAIGAALNRMKRNIGEGKAGGILGIDNKELQSIAPEKAFLKAGQLLAGIRDPMQRAKMEMELFGRGGAELDSVLQKLTTNFQYWDAAVASEADANNLARIGEQLETLSVKAQKVAITFGGYLAEVLKRNVVFFTALATGTDIAEVYNNMTEDEEGLKRMAAAHNVQGEAIQAATKALADMQSSYDKLIDPRNAMMMDAEKATAGLNPDAAKDYVDQIMALYDAMEAFNKAKKENENWDKHIEDVKKYGEELRKSTQTPLEEFSAKLKEIEAWRKEALWRHEKTGEGPGDTNAVATAAILKARKQAIDAMMKESPTMKFAGAAEMGSQEAFKAIAEFAAGRRMEKQEDLLRRQLDTQVNSLTELKGIKDAVDKADNIEEVEL